MRLTWVIFILVFSHDLYSRSILNGTFLHFGYPSQEELPLSEVPQLFQELSDLGMDTLVIEAIKHKEKGCGSKEFNWVKGFPEKLPRILEQANKKKMKVYIGLVSTMHSCPEFYQPLNFDKTLTETENIVQLLHKYKGINGWYLPDEPAHLENHYHLYFRSLVRGIRKYSKLPIIVSPYLKDLTGKILPKELGARAVLFKNKTGVDIQAWQDSVGADGILNKEAYFKVLSNKLGPSGFWANLELFNWGKKPFEGGGYESTSYSRLGFQLKQTDSRYTNTRISWLGQRHIKGSLLAALKHKTIEPVSYSYLSNVSKTYPDINKTLINKKTASPLNYLDSEWVGVLGDTDIIFDLGIKKKIDWVSVHLLHQKAEGISFPDSMTIYCEDSLLLTELLPVELKDSEYVFSNQKALGRFCQKIRIKFKNSHWTFLSEVDFI